ASWVSPETLTGRSVYGDGATGVQCVETGLAPSCGEQGERGRITGGDAARSVSTGTRGRGRPRHTGYGRVLAISGTAASPWRFGCCGPRWYLVSPSFRNSKLSSGESDILNSSRSAAEIIPASASASKLMIFFQYSLPYMTMTIFLASFSVWARVTISKNSSSVPKPPGKITSALARYANQNLRMKK